MLVFAARRPAVLRRAMHRTLVADVVRPMRKTVSPEERTALRAARKKRAARALAQQQQGGDASASAATTTAPRLLGPTSPWIWYLGVIVPSGLIAWAINDENSPPAQFSRLIGLTKLITGFTDEISKPSHEKLLPSWDQMANVPQDIPVPHTLVLDLENTLVSSTWDRRYGWRHAKRPGVDKFLHKLAQYYEIVLYSPSIDAIADPVVTSLDKTGCIMHRLYRESTHYKNGVHVKDLNRLNRNVNRMVVLDDDAEALQFNPDNLIRVKPYEDPSDRTDNTLERITPFLIEIARQGCNDVPSLLRQYRGLDADQIADAYEERIHRFRDNQQRRAQRGLGGLAGRGAQYMPPPELSAVREDERGGPPQLTAKDLVGAPPVPMGGGGMMQFLNQRAQEKEEQNRRKFEKWNEVMMKKQQEKRAAAAANN